MDNEVTSKDEILEALYGIRATMSMISDLSVEYQQKYSQMKQLYADSIEMEQQIRTYRARIEEQEAIIPELDKKIDVEQTAKDHLIEERAKVEATPEREYRSKAERVYRVKFPVTLVIAILCGVLELLGLILLVLTSNDGFIGMPAALLEIPAMIVFFVYGLRRGFKESGVQIKAKTLREYDEEIQEAEANIEQLTNTRKLEVSEVPKRIARLNESIDECTRKIADNKANIQRLTEEREALNKRALTLYNSATETYADFFHPQNWINLDRVVFYLTTGRANTLMDALNLMDQRLNAEMIADEVRMSSSVVRNSIQNMQQSVQYGVANCARAIYDSNVARIEAMHAIAPGFSPADIQRADTAISTQKCLTGDTQTDGSTPTAGCEVVDVVSVEPIVTEQELRSAIIHNAATTMEDMMHRCNTIIQKGIDTF